MKHGKAAGLGELKALWQAAGQRAPEQRARDPRKAQQRETGERASAHTDTPHEDAQLFRRAVQSVTPLATPLASSAVQPRASTPRHTAVAAPSPEQLAKRQAALGLDGELGPDSTPASAPLSDHYAPHLLPSELGLAWHAPDLAADTPRRLQRGHWPVTARLDLHGLRTDAARSALTAFIADCVSHRVRCARIIHGLGHGSGLATPVLREKVPAWLMQHPAVCAFVQAPASEGGKGALVTLLRAANNQETNPKAV